MNLNISRTELVIAFEKNPLIRRRIFEFEDLLADQFKTPFLALSVPDNFEPSFSRIEADSHNGHSKLRVSQNSLFVSTTYDENYRDKPDEIRGYLDKRFGIIRNLLEVERILYFGFVVDILYYLESDLINDLFAKHTGFKSIGPNTIDFNFSHSIPFLEKYYLTLTASKFLESVVSLPEEGGTAPRDMEEHIHRHGIQIRLDLNTKKSHHAGGEFQEAEYDQLFETLFTLISNSTLEDYLSGTLK